MKVFLGIFTVLTVLFSAYGEDELGVVKIEPNGKQRFVRLGDKLEAQCYVVLKSSENAAVSWKLPSDTGVIQTTTRPYVGDGKKKIVVSIEIDSITSEHLGDYDCTSGISSNGFKLVTLQEKVSSPNFTYGEGQVILSCSLPDKKASDIEKVEWLKNDTLVSKLTEHKRFKVDADNYTLTIKDPVRTDADMYHARFIFKNMAESTYDCSVPFRAAPFVVPFDKSKNLIEEDSLELQCDVKGYPHAEVTWMKDGKELFSGDHITMTPLHGFKNARIYIRSVAFDDAGDYTCKAFSTFFNKSVSESLVVRVKDKLAALWPFLGIVCEVIVLCSIIFIYEKRRNKQTESEANNAQDVDSGDLKKEGVRHRGQKK